MTEGTAPAETFEVAHVLFMDIAATPRGPQIGKFLMKKSVVSSKKSSGLHWLIVVMLTASIVSGAAAQQQNISRYDVYTGFAYLSSPHVSLGETGYHAQIGVNRKSWYSLGFDYSVANGQLGLTPGLLTTSLQTQLGQQLAPLEAAGAVPAGYKLQVPVNSKTRSFAAGPQFAYRHFSRVTLFVRPSLGAIHEIATPAPQDAVASLIVKELAPAGHKQDWAGFFGFGFGADVEATQHVWLRLQMDVVHDHLFTDLLKDGRNTIRFSVGPSFHFGRNIAR